MSNISGISGVNAYSYNMQTRNTRKDERSAGGFEAKIRKFEAMKALHEASPNKSMTAIEALDRNIAKFKELSV